MSSASPQIPAQADLVERVRGEFPILGREVHGSPLVYLDSGASVEKPAAVIDAVADFDRTHYANVHRGVHTLSEEATRAYEDARETVARHLKAETREIVFTRNVTGALNLVAHAWGNQNVGPGDRIVLTEMEHHSNIVPWYLLAQRTGAEIDWVEIDDEGHLVLESYAAALARGPKLAAFTHVSNVLGTLNPVVQMVEMAREAGVTTIVDGAQAAPKMNLDLKAIGADFYGFTGHKAYGPSGIGVLYGRRELLDDMEPFEGGGSMIAKVTKEDITWAAVPARFEAGTPPITQAVGLGAAIRWMDEVGLDAIAQHEARLTSYAIPRLQEIPGLTLFGPPTAADRAGILSFDLEGLHPHDVSEILDRHGVAVRAGHHCAQVLMKRLDVPATTRASVAVYNTTEEIDALVDAIRDARRVFGL